MIVWVRETEIESECVCVCYEGFGVSSVVCLFNLLNLAEVIWKQATVNFQQCSTLSCRLGLLSYPPVLQVAQLISMVANISPISFSRFPSLILTHAHTQTSLMTWLWYQSDSLKCQFYNRTGVMQHISSVASPFPLPHQSQMLSEALLASCRCIFTVWEMCSLVALAFSVRMTIISVLQASSSVLQSPAVNRCKWLPCQPTDHRCDVAGKKLIMVWDKVTWNPRKTFNMLLLFSLCNSFIIL